MGADLTIKCNGRYFRDSYNCYNLLWQLGLDYWVYFNKMLNKKGELPVENAKKVLEEIKNRKHNLANNQELMTEENKKFFEQHYNDFVSFLEEAIEKKSPIESSI